MNDWPLSDEEHRSLIEEILQNEPPGHLTGDRLYAEVEHLGNRAYDRIHRPGLSLNLTVRRLRLKGQKWYRRGTQCWHLVGPLSPGGSFTYTLYMDHEGNLFLLQGTTDESVLHVGESGEYLMPVAPTMAEWHIEIVRRLLVRFLEITAVESLAGG